MKKLIKNISFLAFIPTLFALSSCNTDLTDENLEFFKKQDINVEVYSVKLEYCDNLNQKVISSLDDRTMEHEYNVLIINDLFASVTLEEDDDYTNLLYDINNNDLCLIYLGYHEEYFGNRGYFGDDEYMKYDGVIGTMFGPNPYLSRGGFLHQDDLDTYERRKDYLEDTLIFNIIKEYIQVEMEY